MKKGTVRYYITPSGENPVSDFLDSLTDKQQAKILRIFSYIKDYGLSAVIPHIKKLKGTPLWEIRILGQDNIRIIYISLQTDNVFILHGFIKKKQKTPQREIEIALNRYNDCMVKRKAS
jgi:phage-related protein